MYLYVVFLPLFMSVFTLLAGRWIGRTGSALLTVGGMFLCLFFSIYIFFEVSFNGTPTAIHVLDWTLDGTLWVDIGLQFDSLSIMMLLIITLISSFVHLYSLEYMKNDAGFIRYLAYLSLFTFFMLVVVTSDSFIWLFVGWEGVGLCSYLLISFWDTRVLAVQAAMKAMILNRIGDLSLLTAFGLMFSHSLSFKFDINFLSAGMFAAEEIYFLGFSFNLLNLICFFLFLGAMSKSAQLGFHMWLPDAMEGPTPVSALIHAATMVTAGVYMVVRCSPLFEHADYNLLFISVVGIFSCCFAAIVGAYQFDVKKIVAYSTCSQLGYMFFSCGMSNYAVSFFHLFNHAFFKALLFLSMGSVIHAMSDEQDFRRMGGLVNLLPFTYVMVMIGSLSLLAFPFLTGFYSKDMILEFTYARFTLDGFFLYILGVIAAFFTAFYSTRLIYWVFLAPVNFYRANLRFIHEPSFFMWFPMFILSILSIFVGYIFSEAFVGVGSLFFGNSIFVSPDHYSVLDAEFNLFYAKYIPLLITLLGIFAFYLSIEFYEKINIYFFSYDISVSIYKFFSRAMYFDLVFVDYLFSKLLKVSYLDIYKYVEKGFFELFLLYTPKFFRRIYKIYAAGPNYGYIFYYFFLIIYFFIVIFFIFEVLSCFDVSFVMFLFYGALISIFF